MKLFSWRTNFLLFTFFLSFGYFSVWYFSEQKPLQAFSVRVITDSNTKVVNLSNKNLVDEFNPSKLTKQELSDFLEIGYFTSNSDRGHIVSVPSCATLIISLNQNGTVTMNSDPYGNVENLNLLAEKLSEIFEIRKEAGVFEVNSNKIYKTVVVKAQLSTKYGDVIKVIDAVKSSGADPIILQNDELPKYLKVKR